MAGWAQMGGADLENITMFIVIPNMEDNCDQSSIIWHLNSDVSIDAAGVRDTPCLANGD